MSNLTRLTRFLDWVSKLPTATHLGREILSRWSDLGFLPFTISKPLQGFFVRVVVEDKPDPIEGFVLAMTVDPENNLFFIQIFQRLSTELVDVNVFLDKLNSFEQLSIDEAVASISLRSRKTNFGTDVPPIRRPECNSQTTSHYRQM